MRQWNFRYMLASCTVSHRLFPVFCDFRRGTDIKSTRRQAKPGLTYKLHLISTICIEKTRGFCIIRRECPPAGQRQDLPGKEKGCCQQGGACNGIHFRRTDVYCGGQFFACSRQPALGKKEKPATNIWRSHSWEM